MRIMITPVGIIKKYVREGEIDVTDGITSRGLISHLNIPGKLKMVAFVNGKKRDIDAPLDNGDEVKLVTLLTGG